jgi:peptidyl-prolyl cis-trans isomerase SurA
MAKRMLLVLSWIFLALPFIQAQDNNDPILFTVADVPVRVSEFKYIYSKTNGKAADFSRASLQEYLDLYIKFKLKVKKAKDMHLDDLEALKEELDGYRRQLADSYLMNKQVTERLTNEVYERSKQDVDINHILVALSPDARPEDTLAAYTKIMLLRSRLVKGEDFGTVAREASEDRSATDNGGHIGYLTALFPNGFYRLETVAYNIPVGQISIPVRTTAGYHLIKVLARRPARGEVEVAHILLRTQDVDPRIVKTRIDTIYKALLNGAPFEQLAETKSEDARSATKGGYVGFVSINRFEQPFEDAAFSIEKDGDYSKPFQTSVGWHILKRISKKEIQPFEMAKSQLEARIKRDARYEMARVAMIDDIKRNNGFKEVPNVVAKYAKSLTDTFFTFRWHAPEPKSPELIFTVGKAKYTLGDFTDFLSRSSRQRLRMGRETPVAEAVMDLYKEYVSETCLRYEEKQLDTKYPEFKSLIREYEEGILLFEATRINVWDKASQDTVGLKNFFKTIQGKYKWDERAIVTVYYVDGSNKSLIEPIRGYSRINTAQQVLSRFNRADSVGIRASEELLEKGKTAEALSFKEWKQGEVSPAKLDTKTNEFTFRKIEKILPEQDKVLNEARGYIIADYQDYLEAQWVESLRKEYPVKTEKATFEVLVKKQ